MRGVVDFHEEAEHRVVVARARWTLDTPSEVMRWYQLHANYFSARFVGPRDLVSVHDEFDLAPRIAELWGSYRAKLHERWVRFSVGVNTNARVQLTIDTSGARYGVPTAAASSVDQAIQALLKMRETRERERVSGENLLRRFSSSQIPVASSDQKKPK
jgi:hypothetical protein